MFIVNGLLLLFREISIAFYIQNFDKLYKGEKTMASVWKNMFNSRKKDLDLVNLKEELEEKFNLLKENIVYGQRLLSIGSWTYDIQKNEVFKTDGIYEILECSPQELDDKIESFYPYVHPDDREDVKRADQEALAGKEYNIEYRIIDHSGKQKYVQDKVTVLLDAEKKPTKIIGTMQDITRRKLLEKDLKEIGENLNQAQKVAGVGSFKYDAIKDRAWWSEEAYEICNISPLNSKKDLDNFIKLVHPEDQIKIQNAVDKCLSGKVYEIKIRIPQADGMNKFIISKGEPLLNEEHQVVGILGTIKDITENELLRMQLRKERNNLIRAQRLVQMGSWEIDMTSKQIYWSEETYRIHGITKKQYDETYEGLLKFVHPDDMDRMKNILENPRKEQYFEDELRIIRPDGAVRNIRSVLETIFDKNGNPTYIYGVTKDITEKKELQKKLDDEKRILNGLRKKFQFLIQHCNDCFGIMSPDGIILYVSPAVEKLSGYSPEEVTGKSIFEFLDGEEKLKLHKMVELVLEDSEKHIQGELSIKTKFGKTVYIEMDLGNHILEPVVKGIVLNWRDITEKKEIEKRNEYITNHDELTKLPNRIYFEKRIRLQCEEAKEKEKSFALMMLNIDGFKYVNDALGYKVGDELIIEIACKLKKFLGSTNVVYRYSADQFAIIVTGSGSIEEYESISKDIANLFSTPFKLGPYELNVTMSMGISIFPEDGTDLDSLGTHVKSALIRAKTKAKNSYSFYSPKMNIQNYKQFILRNDLPKAIREGQFKVYYQPMVNLKTNEILGAEALIRWDHPMWGLVSPIDFISIAEKTGFIIDMADWMLREVCGTYKKWLEDGLPAIKISINYSVVNFYESSFVSNIENTIEEFNLDPKFLIIEITESILLENSEQILHNIEALRVLGIQVALDDFGTGYSSLQYLNTLDIDILKIDGSFIRDAVTDNTSNIITRTVIKMSQELGIKLIVEGIETREQLSYLQRLNCHTGQGYLYSKPIQTQEFEKILSGKKLKLINDKDSVLKEMRKFFRVEFTNLLEGDMTILAIDGNNVNLGYTKILIEDIGPGGLAFISNIRFPIKESMILQFKTELIGEEIKVCGHPVWTEELQEDLYEYGIEFVFDENERTVLTRVLNQFQIKMRNNVGFSEGRFISHSPLSYFSETLARK